MSIFQRIFRFAYCPDDEHFAYDKQLYTVDFAQDSKMIAPNFNKIYFRRFSKHIELFITRFQEGTSNRVSRRRDVRPSGYRHHLYIISPS